VITSAAAGNATGRRRPDARLHALELGLPATHLEEVGAGADADESIVGVDHRDVLHPLVEHDPHCGLGGIGGVDGQHLGGRPEERG